MWDRKELKSRGKAAFRANYWRCVLVALLIMVVIGGGAGAAGGTGSGEASTADDNSYEYSQTSIALPVLTGIVGGAALVGLAVDILLLNPLEVSCRRFFLVNGREPATLGELGYAFRNNYGNMVATILLRDVYLFLWALLLVVPALIKVYSYRLVPYLLSENPALSPSEAITRSRQLMNGNKWNAFVLDLSFIGWYLLTAVTAGLLGIFYVYPYVAATDAELYRAICAAKSE